MEKDLALVHRTPSHLLVWGVAGCLAALGSGHLLAQGPPQERYGTHDWTPSTEFNETWVDAKSPGDGFTYAVGTAQVHEVLAGTLYSNFGLAPNPFGDTDSPIGATRQVVVLQKTGRDQAIVKQAMFYGSPTLQTERPVNAWGISVWPVLDPVTHEPDPIHTRIAICGESADDKLPLSQDPGGNTQAKFKGYIAVYNGNCVLQWSHHFFDSSIGPCAITDVSMRYDAETDEDIVTFCGIVATGNPIGLPPSWLTPVLPFDPPPPPSTRMGGDVHNLPLQWDGLVGRLTNSHSVPTTAGVSNAQTTFLSFVGGELQDGLFGIDELDASDFVVVGSTGGAPASSSYNSFPFTTGVHENVVGTNYSLGTFMAFHFNPGAPLVLDEAFPLGTDPLYAEVGQGNTVARDVVIQRNRHDENTGFEHLAYVVGSTSDADLLDNTTGGVLGNTAFYRAPQPILGGGADGFLFAMSQYSGSWSPYIGTFKGGPGDEGLTGVQIWNEAWDHVSVLGFQMPPALDMECATYFIDTPDVGPAPAGIVPDGFELLRDATVGGSSTDRPTATGAQNATANWSGVIPFDEYLLGPPGGGGICVDERGRINIVGSTDSSNFPVTGRPYQSNLDAVRVVLDMLPPGVGRSDMTGDLLSGAPLAGTTGSTTPTTALNAFGNQLGIPAPTGSLMRMLIDWEGPSPGPTSGPPPLVPEHFIIVDRPPQNWNAVACVMQYGLAVPPAAPLASVGLIEDWVPSGVTLAIWFISGSPDASFRIPLILPTAPPGGITYSAQAVIMMTSSLACSGCSVYAATPAINFFYL